MNQIEAETGDGQLGEIVDEVLGKMSRGEAIDVEQYAREHPDVAEVLRHALPALARSLNRVLAEKWMRRPMVRNPTMTESHLKPTGRSVISGSSGNSDAEEWASSTRLTKYPLVVESH